ncbi:MAG: DEAD/DEAH box helicase [Defluviitaleaceae bacterium]|nr:DEAD/DEAH box helicase [Defluviitaleaceae bacterium]
MKNLAITRGIILNLSSNTDVYERGERYFQDGKLLSYTPQADARGGSVVRAGIEGNYKNYNVSVVLDDGGALVSYTCSCESHSIWRGACKHVVAVLFAAMEGGTQNAAVEVKRRAGAELTDALERLVFDGVDAGLDLPSSGLGAQVQIVPTLRLERRGIFVSFALGTARMYQMRNIEHFVESMKREEVVSYGAGLEFAHRRGQFDEAARRFVDFIVEENTLYTEVGKQLSKQYTFTRRPGQTARELSVNERNIDAFFDLFAGDKVKGDGDFRAEITLRTGVPALAFRITHGRGNNEDTTVLKGEYPAFLTLAGRRHHYMVTEAGITRLPTAESALIVRLLHALKDADDQEIVFAGENRMRFLTIVLPVLVRMGLVTQTEGEVPLIQTAPPITRIYIDTDSTQRSVSAQIKFDYGQTNADDAPDARDYVAEYTVRRTLNACGFEEYPYPGCGDDYFLLKDDDAIYHFLYAPDGGMAKLHALAEVFISEDVTAQTCRPKRMQMGVRLRGGLLDITLDEEDFAFDDLLEALESYRERKKYVRLRDGRFMDLSDEALASPLQMLDALDVGKKDVQDHTVTLPAYRALYLDTLTAQNPDVTRDAQFNQLVTDCDKLKSTDIPVPHGMKRILRDYQKMGFRWLKTLSNYGFGGILADDMGLGKTLQVITLLESERQTLEHPSLIVVPTSLLYNWENEFAKFAPKLRVQIISGVPERRRDLLENTPADVFITTYDTLKRDVDFYAPHQFAYLVADEAQNIKNPATVAASSVKSLKAHTRFALTGTPIENNLQELWSIFDFIMPGYLHAPSRFAQLYEQPIVRDNNTERIAALRAQIAPFVLRRIKANVLKELPAKTETTLPAAMTPEQKRVYQAYLLEAVGALDEMITSNTFNQNRISILAKLTRLRQICCDPALFIDNYDGGSGKFDLALETIQIALESGRRVLLFSQFTKMLARFTQRIDADRSLQYFYLDGATPAQQRMDMCTRFNAGERDVFFISLKAGGTGLNLTGAEVVIHYDPWWNPSVMDQASDRAHRFGQKKAVQVFNIVAKDSLEEKIMELQEKKRGLIDSVIAEGGSFIDAMDAEEMRRLFVG